MGGSSSGGGGGGGLFAGFGGHGGGFGGSPGNGGPRVNPSFGPMGWFNGKKYQGGMASGPRPDIPDGESIRSSNGSDSLKAGFAYEPHYASFQGADRKGLDALTSRAMAKGDSPWLKMMGSKIDAQTSGLRDQATKDASVAQGQGMSNLAMSGGLDSGARERMASQSALGRMGAVQGASQLGTMGKLDAGLQDEQAKLSILQSLPQHEMAFSNQINDNARYNTDIYNRTQAGNVDNRIADVARGNASDLYKYGQQMQGYGADRTAAATQQAGKKGTLK